MDVDVASSEVIHTPRCRLRYPHEDDIPHFWSALQNEEFCNALAGKLPHSIEQLKAAMERAWARWNRGTSYYWTIETRQAHDFIGRIKIKKHRENAGHWSIGYWVHPEQQNRGYASECARAILKFGFNRLRADAIVSGHATWNAASGAVLRNAGMKETGETARGYRKGGKWVAVYDYAISRDEYCGQSRR